MFEEARNSWQALEEPHQFVVAMGPGLLPELIYHATRFVIIPRYCPSLPSGPDDLRGRFHLCSGSNRE